MNDKIIEKNVKKLLARMTLKEKIGQLVLHTITGSKDEEDIRRGQVSSYIGVKDLSTRNRLQKIAVEQSRLGIPLLFGLDIIHGSRTIFPIPLGQAAGFNPELVEKSTRAAAMESIEEFGLDWTWSPVLDVARDPRWGRVMETYGEDPFLAARMGQAAIRGYQGTSLDAPGSVAACGKHFAGYAAVEGGREYNMCWLPEPLLREVHLAPFRAAVEAGVATIMCGGFLLNGIYCSANKHILGEVLKKEWSFKGFVVTDFGSIGSLVNKIAQDRQAAGSLAVRAGVDMDMCSGIYHETLEKLVKQGVIKQEIIDEAVRRILRIKMKLGLFHKPYREHTGPSAILCPEYLETAKKMAVQSLVLLKNENAILPLKKTIKTMAVIGPLADNLKEQLGNWVPNGPVGKMEAAISPLAALKEQWKSGTILYAPGVAAPSNLDKSGITQAVAIAQQAEAVLLLVGEEARLSGEAASRAFINLPGVQEELIAAVAATGKPIVLVIMAGRPLIFHKAAEQAKAIIYAWHPGTMGGPAIVDVLLGKEAPSGKLPISFPRAEGQIPIYYGHRGKLLPVEDGTQIPMGQPVMFPHGMEGWDVRYCDLTVSPAYGFGFGLSYTEFAYSNLKISKKTISSKESLAVTVDLTNTGKMAAEEIVQLYIQDIVASTCRPEKELRNFTRVYLKPKETKQVRFTITARDLEFYSARMRYEVEPGEFRVFVGGNCRDTLTTEFKVKKK